MENKIDIVLERVNKGFCPICNKPIGTDFKVEEYKQQKIWICKTHPTVEVENE